MNYSTFFSLRYGGIVRSQSELTSVLISLPNPTSFVAVSRVLAGTAMLVLGREPQGVPGSLPDGCVPATWRPLSWVQERQGYRFTVVWAPSWDVGFDGERQKSVKLCSSVAVAIKFCTELLLQEKDISCLCFSGWYCLPFLF